MHDAGNTSHETYAEREQQRNTRRERESERKGERKRERERKNHCTSKGAKIIAQCTEKSQVKTGSKAS
jgi:hypothetical protein